MIMDNTIREVITIQAGHYSNFIGAHWWNIQESGFVYNGSTQTDINPDYLFRDGITCTRQETYTPRLLIIDSKGSLGSLPTFGSLYFPQQKNPSYSEATWDGKIELVEQIPEKKNNYLVDLEKEDERFNQGIDEDKDICIDDFHDEVKPHVPSHKIYDLKNSVHVWSDFLRTHLHPSTIYLLKDVFHERSSIPGKSGGPDSSWRFSSGFSLIQKDEIEEGITDRIRMLAESCGSLQGFNLLCDIHDGMGGLSQGILQHFDDEYSNKISMTFAVVPPHLDPTTPQNGKMIQASIIQACVELSNLSSLMIPLSFKSQFWNPSSSVVSWPDLEFQMENAYETSSILASFIDTSTLAYRKKNSPVPLSSLADLLTPGGRKVASGSLALPLGLPLETDLRSFLQKGELKSLVSVSGSSHSQNCLRSDLISECRVIRGLSDSKVIRAGTVGPSEWKPGACNIYDDYLQENQNAAKMRIIVDARDPLKTATPYPHIFKPWVTNDGYINSRTKKRLLNVESVSAISKLYQGAAIGHYLKEMLEMALKINVNKLPELVNDGMNKEAWSVLQNDLQNLVSCYDIKMAAIDSD